MELARDFLDYFLCAKSAEKIVQRYGIDNVTLKYDGRTKGIGLEKAVSEKLKASYQVEKSSTKETESAPVHKVGGEYKITESLSVGAEKELKQETTQSQEQPQTNDKVILKYKKKF